MGARRNDPIIKRKREQQAKQAQAKTAQRGTRRTPDADLGRQDERRDPDRR